MRDSNSCDVFLYFREVTEPKNRNRFGKVPINVLRSGTKNAATQTEKNNCKLM